MKKLSKTLTAIALIIAMVVVMVVPVSAVTCGYKWSYFSSISLYSNNNYVRFAQSYLYRFNNSIHSIWDNTTSIIDGDFGYVTRDAAIAFQTFVKNYYDINMVIDGIIGSQTWGYMAEFAVDDGTKQQNGNTHYVFKIGNTSYSPNDGFGIVGSRLPSGSYMEWHYNSNTGTGGPSLHPFVTN